MNMQITLCVVGTILLICAPISMFKEKCEKFTAPLLITGEIFALVGAGMYFLAKG